MSLIIPNAKIGLFDSEGKLVLEMPSIFDTAVQNVLSKCWRKHNGYIKVGLDVPFKPRSRRAQGIRAATSASAAQRLEEIKP
jgi:hypothetical protein